MRKDACLLGGAIVLLLASPSRADRWPSFNLVKCAWDATDIVVAEQQGRELTVVETDEIKVLETWQGDLVVGTMIRGIKLPTMPMRVGGMPGELWRWDEKTPDKRVTGDRVVLFLKHPQAKAGDPPPQAEWQGAGDFGWFEFSAVWLDGGGAYALQPELLPVRLSSKNAKNFKQETLDILAAKRALAAAGAIADPAARAAALEPLTHGPIWQQRNEAIAAMGQCGLAAAPALERMLRQYDDKALQVTTALARAQGEGAGPEMTRLLKEELAYWKKRTPARSDGVGRTEEEHHRVLKVALNVVAETRYLPARDVVRELRDLFVARRQPNENPDTTMTHWSAIHCSDVLLALDQPAEANVDRDR